MEYQGLGDFWSGVIGQALGCEMGSYPINGNPGAIWYIEPNQAALQNVHTYKTVKCCGPYCNETKQDFYNFQWFCCRSCEHWYTEFPNWNEG
jgi:hypothetical protein